MYPIPLKIAGMGRYAPEHIVTNDELEARCGLPSGWIEQRTGVLERHWSQTETASQMAGHAVRDAVQQAGLSLSDIDLIINASGTPEQVVPDGGALLQRELGLTESGIPAFSIHMTCLSFLAALQTAAAYLQTGLYRRILISSSEIVSSGLNFNEPESATLLGDAAAAVVVTLPEAGSNAAVHAMRFETFSSGADFTAIFGGGTRKHPNNPATRPEDNLFSMNGPRLLNLALRTVPQFLEHLRAGLSHDLGDIKMVIPHQTSKAGFRLLSRFGYSQERVMMTLDRYGNCGAASIPFALSMAYEQGCIYPEDEVLLVGTGAGVSIGGVILVL